MMPNGTVSRFGAAPSDRYLSDIAVGPDGNLWFIDTESNATNNPTDKIGRMRL